MKTKEVIAVSDRNWSEATMSCAGKRAKQGVHKDRGEMHAAVAHREKHTVENAWVDQGCSDLTFGRGMHRGRPGEALASSRLGQRAKQDICDGANIGDRRRQHIAEEEERKLNGRGMTNKSVPATRCVPCLGNDCRDRHSSPRKGVGFRARIVRVSPSGQRELDE